MKSTLIIMLALPLLAAPPALTGKRRAALAGSKVIEKAERAKSGKKGATNEWETARTFPLMFNTRPSTNRKGRKP